MNEDKTRRTMEYPDGTRVHHYLLTGRKVRLGPGELG
jgi:hypothetical protein